MFDYIIFLWILPSVREIGTIIEVLNYESFKTRLHGGEISTFLPIHARSKYKLSELQLMFLKKKILPSAFGLSLESLSIRQDIAVNTLIAQRKRTIIEVAQISISPRFDKIVYIDDKLLDTNIGQHPIEEELFD